MKVIRCAIYTRKSSEEGLEQEFNSLHAQREACEAYVKSQKAEGWVALTDVYDDGGISGGTMERPALQRLLSDIDAGRVDQIIVYKIDRLTRSLADFAKIVDRLDASQCSFVSVTQSFNTATSMGRLTLNMLLSFAQFEREVTAERIRDKIAASKRRGLWMGGHVPLGYEADGRTLKINEAEAKTVRTLYDLYERLGTVRAVKAEADQIGLCSKKRQIANGKTSGGNAFDRGHIHYILTNPLYAGRIRHRNKVHDGQHAAIIDPDRWASIQSQLQDGASKSRGKAVATQSSLLCGKLFDETGDRLTPSHSKTRRGVRLRYYISHRLIKQSGVENPGGWRVPAVELERKIAHLVCTTISRHGFAGALLPGATADQIAETASRLAAIIAAESIEKKLDLVSRVDIAAGSLNLLLDKTQITKALALDPDQLESSALASSHPFQRRKRGVETKIVLADSRAVQDEVLLRNIARAHVWYEQIKTGKTFAEIAVAEQTSSRRIQQLIELAFLSPKIVRDVIEGAQPIGFTTEFCMRKGLPSDWQEQRQVLATL